jgi:hypothetical protein
MASPKTSRRATRFSDVDTVAKLQQAIDHMAAGFPPKVLVVHYPFSSKLLNTYWRQTAETTASKGGIPGSFTLFRTRRHQLAASLFCVAYLAEAESPRLWRKPDCLDTIIRAQSVLEAYDLKMPHVNAWALARLLVAGQLRLSLCRTCKMVYVWPAGDYTKRLCVHCAMGAAPYKSHPSRFSRCCEHAIAAHNGSDSNHSMSWDQNVPDRSLGRLG